MSHTLSIIICTKDREESLKDCLDSVFCQARQPDEIIIVDDGDLNGSEFIELIKKHGIYCQLFKKDTPGLTRSRNLGIDRAKGDVILFLDDDVSLDPGYVEGIMKIYEADEEGRIGGVTGVIRRDYRPGVQPLLRFFGLDSRRQGVMLPCGIGTLVRDGSIQEPTRVEWLTGCNMSYRRRVFDGFRFDEALGGYGWGEDRDFSFRVAQKYELWATPEAKLVHLEDPKGRLNPRRFGFVETNYLYRFFAKNIPKRLLNWLALAWAMVGIVLKNVLLLLATSGRRSRIGQVRGNLEGMLAIWSGRDVSS